MAVLNSESKVLIIGSGVSGLSLAQILRKESIPFEIYERDDGTRSQGWTISLDHCLDRLFPLLPRDITSIYNASANNAIGLEDGMAFYDGTKHQLLGVVGNVEKGFPGHNICASRGRFREILSEKLDIQFKKRATKYESDADGVTVYFDDGSIARGAILVAADGANSTVRGQLIPGFKSTPSTSVAIHGNILLTKDKYAPIVANGHSGVVMGDVGLKFYMVVLEFYPDDATALFNWNCSFRSQDSYADYEWTQTATPKSLHEKVLGLIAHFPPFVVEPIATAGPSCVHQPPVGLFETVLPLQGLPRGPVTLVGDSAHSMVPFRGMGANTAIMDACDLGEALIEGIKTSAPILSVLKSYEDLIIPRGRQKVLESRATGESGDGAELAGGRLSDHSTGTE